MHDEQIQKNKAFKMQITNLQPSQLYLNKVKLEKIRLKVEKSSEQIKIIPVSRIGNDVFLTDGHHTAYVYAEKGIDEILVYWDEDEIDLEMYEICIDWCIIEGISTVLDLENRILTDIDYQALWLDRCSKMHEDVKRERIGKNG